TNIAVNTGSNSPGELEMTRNTSEVAVCCSSDSERCSRASARYARASASSRVRASSCFFNSISELGSSLTCALAFVPVERSLRPRVGLFAPLRDKVTSSARSIDPCWSPQLTIRSPSENNSTPASAACEAVHGAAVESYDERRAQRGVRHAQ